MGAATVCPELYRSQTGLLPLSPAPYALCPMRSADLASPLPLTAKRPKDPSWVS
jgi:hypothetical protein